MITAAIIIGVIILAIVFTMFLFRGVFRVAEANEALIISGLGASQKSASSEGMDFKIVVGKGVVVLPGFQTVRRLNLDTRTTTLPVTCVSSQGIPVKVRGVVAYKIGDDYASIANAARRFLDQQGDIMQAAIHELFAGHLRAAVGGVTIEDMLHNRETLTEAVRSTLESDLQRLGLVVDSLQLQEIDDEVGYIDNLGRPDAAAVASKARIAEAERDKEATEREQMAASEKAAYIRDSEVKQAAAQAAVDSEKAKATQAGPLAQALAAQQVVEAETRTSELRSALTEQELSVTVKKPADAAAYQVRVKAEADRDARVRLAEASKSEAELKAVADATRVTTAATADATATEASALAKAKATQAIALADAAATEAKGKASAVALRATGEAEAAATEAKGKAEGAAIQARAEALAVQSEAVIAQQLAENYPEVVRAAASAFDKVGTMVVLNGAEGVEDMLGKVLTMGGAGYGLAKKLVSEMSEDAKIPLTDGENKS